MNKNATIDWGCGAKKINGRGLENTESRVKTDAWERLLKNTTYCGQNSVK
ncbi:hypothetical protein GCM10009113_00080 [Marinobacter szutsaonensis]